MVDTPAFSRSLGTVLLLTATIFLIIGIQLISYLVTLIVVALILAMLAYPATKVLKSRGLPEGVAVGVVTVVASLLVLLLCYVVFFSFESLIQDLPLFQQELSARLAEIITTLHGFGIDTGSFSAS